MTASLSRRAILAAVAAVPALAVPALAVGTQPKEYTDDELRRMFAELRPGTQEFLRNIALEHVETENKKRDAKLIELWEKLQQAKATWKKFINGPQARAERRYDKLRGPSPLWADIPPKFKRYFSDDTVSWPEVWRVQHKNESHPMVAWYKKASKRMAKELADYEQKSKRARKESGFADAEVEQGRLYDRCWSIYNAIVRVRARTPAGMAVKFKAAQMMAIDDDLDAAESAWKSLRADVVSLSG